MTVKQPSTWLLLDTSGRTGFVALSREGVVVSLRRLSDARRQARDLVPETQELLTRQNLAPRDLTGVIVSLGPGSYTGLRVGLMSAKVLAYSTGCLLVGVPTFEILAAQVPGVGPIEVLTDAQKDRVYHQSFVGDEQGIRSAGELQIIAYETWLETCPAGARVTGPGAVKYPDRLPTGSELVAPELREPTPESLLHQGLARFARGQRDDPFALEPLYLRPSSAEEQWDARRK